MAASIRTNAGTRMRLSVSIIILAAATVPAWAAGKDRVYIEIRNDSPAGNNARGIYAELKGTDHQFIGWGGTAWTPAAAGQPLRPNANGALLFTNTAAAPDPLPSAAAPTAMFSQLFKMNQTVAPNNYLLFDSVRDSGGSLCQKVENGCLRPTELTTAAGLAVPATKRDPFNRFIRRPAGRSVGTGFEIEITNTSATLASLDLLEILVNNSGNIFDLSQPWSPDGIAATLISPSFVPGQLLAPDESITLMISGSFDDTLPISVGTAGTIDGAYLRGLTATVLPEPATIALLVSGIAAGAARRVRASVHV